MRPSSALSEEELEKSPVSNKIDTKVSKTSVQSDEDESNDLEVVSKKCPRKFRLRKAKYNKLVALLKRLSEEADVKRVRMESFSLRKVPPEVFRYKNTLVSLSLASNRLRVCPPAVWACVSLKRLDLSRNLLTEIPNEMDGNLEYLKEFGLMTLSVENCEHLEELDLSYNKIVSLPAELGECASLHTLNLSHNCLDTIFGACRNLRALTCLDVSGNRIENLPDNFFEHLTELNELCLSDNRLTELEYGIHTLHNLEKLVADGNEVKEIPWRIYHLTSLRKLHLSRNRISGLPKNKFTGAAEFGKVVAIEDVDLSENNMSELGEEIGKCTRLRSLALDGNRLKELPGTIGKCAGLRKLSVARNALRSLTPAIRSMGELEVLDVSQNDLANLPKEIQYLTSLERFNAHSNRLRELPSSMGATLGNVRELTLHANSIVALPKDIGGMTRLKSLKLSPNCLTSLSPSMGRLVLLTDLDISHNQLSSVCAESIGTLTALTRLDVSHNRLRSFPDVVGCLERLKSLRLSHNVLERLPNELGSATSLRTLFVDHNRLTCLPPKMMQLTNLIGCDLSYNRMTQTPPHFRALSGWIFCDMTGNCVEEDRESLNAETLYFRASHFVDSGKEELAVEILTKALAEDRGAFCVDVKGSSSTKRRARALSLRARALDRLGRVNAAVNDLNASEELGLLTTDMLLRRALLYRRQNQTVFALNDLTAAIERMPTLHTAYKHRALLLYRIGRYRDAKADIKRLLDMPQMRRSEEEGIGSAAADDVVASVAVDPFDCLMLLGHVHLRSLNHNRAYRSFVDASKWRPDRPEAHLYSAIALQRRGEHEAAVEAFNHAESLIKKQERTSLSSSKTERKETKTESITPMPARYRNEILLRLLLRRQASQTVLDKMKLAKRDWLDVSELEKMCAGVAMSEACESASPVDDDAFLWSMGIIERPLPEAPLWQATTVRPICVDDNSTNAPRKMPTRPPNFWKGYEVEAATNCELRVHEAAVRIQALLRGVAGQRVATSQYSARLLQAWLRGARTRREVAKIRSARKLQALFRGMRDRSRALKRRKLYRAVRTVASHAREHALVLQHALAGLREDDKIADILRGPGRRVESVASEKAKWESESANILRRWIQKTRILALQESAALAAVNAVMSAKLNILNESENAASGERRALKVAVRSANRFVHRAMSRSLGLDDDDDDDASDSKDKLSTIEILRVLPGSPPDVPRVVDSLRSGRFGVQMYHEFIAWRVNSKRPSLRDAKHTSAYAALTASLAVIAAKRSCKIATIRLSLATTTLRFRERNDVAKRVVNAGSEVRTSNDVELTSLTLQRATMIALAAATDSSIARECAERIAYLAYKRITVTLREKPKILLWDLPPSSQDGNAESLELARGCPLVEMAHTRHGWSWVVYEPPSRRRKLAKGQTPASTLVGAVPSSFCAARDEAAAKAALAAYTSRTHLNREMSHETPAVRKERCSNVYSHLHTWLAPAYVGIERAYEARKRASGRDSPDGEG